MSAESLLRDYLLRLDGLESIEFIQMTKDWDMLFSPILGEVSQSSNLTDLEFSLFQASISYAQLNAALIAREQDRFIQEGLSSAQDMLNLSNRPYDTMAGMDYQTGFTSDGVPLDSFLLDRYQENVVTGLSLLLAGLGVVALTNALQANLTKSFQVARTEQMFAFREAQVEQFKQAGFVKMKNWVGEPSACGRICIPAIGKNPYPLNAPMISHPNCRCGWEPVFVPLKTQV